METIRRRTSIGGEQVFDASGAGRILRFEPAAECAHRLVVTLSDDLRHDRPAFARTHHVPHRACRCLALPYIGGLAGVRDEVIAHSASLDAVLLDLVAHGNPEGRLNSRAGRRPIESGLTMKCNRFLQRSDR